MPVLDRSVYFRWGDDHPRICILYDGSCEHFNLSAPYHNIMEIEMNQIFYEVTGRVKYRVTPSREKRLNTS